MLRCALVTVCLLSSTASGQVLTGLRGLKEAPTATNATAVAHAAANATVAAVNGTAAGVAHNVTAHATGNTTAAAAGNTTTAAAGNTTVVDICNPSGFNNCTEEYATFKGTLMSAMSSEKERDQAIEYFCQNSTCGAEHTARDNGFLKGVCKPTTTNVTHHAMVETNTTTEGGNDAHRRLDDSLDFLRYRWGAPLGCLKDGNGTICVTLRGCEFWKSCCAVTWAKLAKAMGRSFPTYFLDQVDAACPGTLTTLKAGTATCDVVSNRL